MRGLALIGATVVGAVVPDSVKWSLPTSNYDLGESPALSSIVTTGDERRRLRANSRLAPPTSPHECSAGIHTKWFLMRERGGEASKQEVDDE